jgi:hypothetical protein
LSFTPGHFFNTKIGASIVTFNAVDYYEEANLVIRDILVQTLPAAPLALAAPCLAIAISGKDLARMSDLQKWR